MLRKQGFEMLIASPPRYNALVAEIYFDGRFVALISQERGSGLFDIETPEPNLVEDHVQRRVEWLNFRDMVDLACRRLRGEHPEGPQK
jgi:hypothetical protein